MLFDSGRDGGVRGCAPRSASPRLPTLRRAEAARRCERGRVAAALRHSAAAAALGAQSPPRPVQPQPTVRQPRRQQQVQEPRQFDPSQCEFIFLTTHN